MPHICVMYVFFASVCSTRYITKPKVKVKKKKKRGSISGWGGRRSTCYNVCYVDSVWKKPPSFFLPNFLRLEQDAIWKSHPAWHIL